MVAIPLRVERRAQHHYHRPAVVTAPAVVTPHAAARRVEVLTVQPTVTERTVRGPLRTTHERTYSPGVAK